jgi:hypothetical protein
MAAMSTKKNSPQTATRRISGLRARQDAAFGWQNLKNTWIASPKCGQASVNNRREINPN